MNARPTQPLLRLLAIEKSFEGVRALKPFSLELAAGEVLGLVGENGAGKSTLIKILSGVHAPDAGEIVWNGSPVRFRTPHEALKSGIAASSRPTRWRVCLGSCWWRGCG